MPKTTLKNNKEDLHYLISMLIIKLWKSRQCGIDVEMDKYFYGTNRVHK